MKIKKIITKILGLLAAAFPFLAFGSGQDAFSTVRSLMDAQEVGAAGLGGAGTYYSQRFSAAGKRKIVFFSKTGTMAGTSPTIDLTIQGSFDGGTTWVDGVAFTQITAAGGYRKDPTAELEPFLRFKIVVGGTSPTGALSLYVAYIEPSMYLGHQS